MGMHIVLNGGQGPTVDVPQDVAADQPAVLEQWIKNEEAKQNEEAKLAPVAESKKKDKQTTTGGSE